LTSGPTVPSRASRIAKPAVIAPNATLIGEVETGANSNLQDGTVVHTAAAGLMTAVGQSAGRLPSLCVSRRAEFRCLPPTLSLTSAARSLRGPPSRAKAGDD